MVKNKEEVPFSVLDGGRMIIRTPFLPLFLLHGLGDVRALMNFRGGSLSKEQGPRSVTRFSLPDEGGEKAFFLKRHRHAPFREQIREFFRYGRFLSGGRREWENIWRIRRVGIPTVDPVGFGERREWGREVESFLISLELREAYRLTEFIPKHLSPPLNSSLLLRKRQLLRKLALLARRMHEAGLFHRDFYLGHLFVKDREEGEMELYLIDLQRVFRPRWRIERWRIKDLASLNFSAPRGWVTAADRLRFYKQYRGISRLEDPDRSLIRRVTRKSQRIWAHTRRLWERGKIQKVPWGFENGAA